MADMLDRRYSMSDPPGGATLSSMPDLHLTIVYESDPDSDWIVASIPEVPGANSQGRTREEAREMVLDSLAGLSELRASEREPLGESLASESLHIVSA
jgi:predicted RNase H-like HicB family nuclease